MSGLMLRAPAVYASNPSRTGGSSVPPIAPIVPLFDAPAAAIPARKEGWANENRIPATFGPDTSLEVTRKTVFGNDGAIRSAASLYSNPWPMTRSYALTAVLAEVLVEGSGRSRLDVADRCAKAVTDSNKPPVRFAVPSLVRDRTRGQQRNPEAVVRCFIRGRSHTSGAEQYGHQCGVNSSTHVENPA